NKPSTQNLQTIQSKDRPHTFSEARNFFLSAIINPIKRLHTQISILTKLAEYLTKLSLPSSIDPLSFRLNPNLDAMKSKITQSRQLGEIKHLTKASYLNGLSDQDWLKLVVSNDQLDKVSSSWILAALIELITANFPPSSRLVSYYALIIKTWTASPNNQSSLSISINHLLIEILNWLSLIIPKSFHPHQKLQILKFLNIISSPLTHLNLNLNLIIRDPIQSIIYLHSILDLFKLLQSPQLAFNQLDSFDPSLSIRFNQKLLQALTPAILSIHPIDLINSISNSNSNSNSIPSWDSLLNKLIDLLNSPQSIPIPSINQVELPSILHHLSPSLSKKFFLKSQNHPTISQNSSSSIRAKAIIISILLKPGLSALDFNSTKSSSSPLIHSIIAFAISHSSHSSNPNSNSSIPNHSWILDLFLAAILIGNTPSSFIIESDHTNLKENPSIYHDLDHHEDEKVSWKALLAGGRLAELIRLALDTQPLKNNQNVLLNQSDLQLLKINLIHKLPNHNLNLINQNSYPSNLSHNLALRNHLFSALLSSISSNELVSPDQLESFINSSSQLNQPQIILNHHIHLDLGLDPLIESLGKSKHLSIPQLSISLHQTLSTASTSFDLSTCISLTKALNGLDTLSTIFLWLQPKDILAPIVTLLDHWTDIRNDHSNTNNNNESEGSSGSEFEKFGALLGWLQGVVARFHLTSNLDLHLNKSNGFTIHYLLNPSTSYPISSLPPSHLSTLSSWIEALYGSSGISDDLLSNTDPRIFFTICASLFKQSFDGLRTGLIDLQTFREGLSYFEQELLVVGCAVGVVGWLINELTRSGSVSATSYPTALLEILQAILLSDSITPIAIQLVSAKSLRLLRSFNSYFNQTQSYQLTLASSNVGDLHSHVQLDIPKLESKLTALPPTGLITPTGFLSFDFINQTNLPNIGWQKALQTSLNMAVNNLDSLDHQNQKNQSSYRSEATIPLWSLLPTILNAMSIEKFIEITINGISAAISQAQEASINPPEINTNHQQIGSQVLRSWDTAHYERVQRAIELAVEIFNWPFELVGMDQLSRFRYKSNHKELHRPWFVSRVLENVFLEWGSRVGRHERIEDGELERDVVLGCLERLENIETAIHTSNASTEELPDPKDNQRHCLSKFYRKVAAKVIKEEYERDLNTLVARRLSKTDEIDQQFIKLHDNLEEKEINTDAVVGDKIPKKRKIDKKLKPNAKNTDRTVLAWIFKSLDINENQGLIGFKIN
ncbi:hypothetical protein O181_067303, partial [Austropuccinia psidii MF-1]|nr:hypothetical protein [Austropuccinia psidii MF-1]